MIVKKPYWRSWVIGWARGWIRQIRIAVLSREFLIDSLHVVTLCGFAVSQPLFDILSKNTAFFVSWKATPEVMIAFIVYLILVLPLQFFVSLEFVAGLIHRRLRKVVHFGLMVLLFCLILLPAVKSMSVISDVAIWSISVLFAVFLSVVYTWNKYARGFLGYLSLGIIVFPVLFLLTPSVQQLLNPKQPELVNYNLQFPQEIPVIVIVYDEFNLSLLLDDDRKIDSALFPNFAALASDSYWFRNTTTVSDDTIVAVPAILTGRYPGKKPLSPTYDDHPDNIFALLGNDFYFNVHESATRLCPGFSCRTFIEEQSLVRRVKDMLSDLRVLLRHIILPPGMLKNEPAIDQGWNRFANSNKSENRKHVPTPLGGWVKFIGNSMRVERGQYFRRFINNISLDNLNSLNFLHILLPHRPSEYLPSGKTYTPTSDFGLVKESWGSDRRAIAEGLQRHMLQLTYTDKLLGELLSHLHQLELYDQSLIVLTADHGVAHQPEDSRRLISKTNYLDILQVPLIIKQPYQKQAIVSDRNVEIVDIFPSVADLLGVDLPFTVDGHSVFDNTIQEKRYKRFRTRNGQWQKYPAKLKFNINAVEYKQKLFAASNVNESLFKIGPYKNLAGKNVNDYQQTALFPAIASLVGWTDEEDGVYFGEQPPGRILGNIQPDERQTNPLSLALVVNNTIQSLSETFMPENNPGSLEFSFILSDQGYDDEKNEVKLFVISESVNGQVFLSPLQLR